jgi:hypothetical protein
MLTSTSRVGIIAFQIAGDTVLWIGEGRRSPADHSPGAFTPTARPPRIPVHLAEAVAAEILAVARRASELRLWDPPESGSAA